MKKIFISYARQDRAIAERLYDDFKNAGFEPWLDVRDLLPGQNWERETINEIRQSNLFVALLSNHSISHRGFVQKELKTAWEVLDQVPTHDVFIIPVRLENCDPSDHRLKRIHWVDLFPDYHDGLRKIFSTLRKISKDELDASGYPPPEGLSEPKANKEDITSTKGIIIHVEDESAYEYLLRGHLSHHHQYIRVSLLSEAAHYINLQQTCGFIIDLFLPSQRLSDFSNWGNYEYTTSGLIKRIRRERPNLPVVVLTNYAQDQNLRNLIKQQLLEPEDVFKKSDILYEESLNSLLRRLDSGH